MKTRKHLFAEALVNGNVKDSLNTLFTSDNIVLGNLHNIMLNISLMVFTMVTF